MIDQAKRLGKKIVLPIIIENQKKMIPQVVENLDEELEQGPYGIKQPIYSKDKVLDLEQIDLTIVPGVAFDRLNNRLGRGAGYYDRFLKLLPEKTLR